MLCYSKEQIYTHTDDKSAKDIGDNVAFTGGIHKPLSVPSEMICAPSTNQYSAPTIVEGDNQPFTYISSYGKGFATLVNLFICGNLQDM